MLTDTHPTGPLEFKRLSEEEVILLRAYRSFTLAERNAVDRRIVELREQRLFNEAFEQRRQARGF